MPTSQRSSSERDLSALFMVDASGPETWTNSDLAEIWEHQLATPLDEITQCQLAQSNQGDAPQECLTFRDVVEDRVAGLDILRAVKAGAKELGGKPTSGVPGDIYKAVYFACVAMAIIRHDEWITSLSAERVRAALEWAMKLTWLDATTMRQVSGALSHQRLN